MTSKTETRLLIAVSLGVGFFAFFIHRPWWGGIAILASLLLSKGLRWFNS